MSFKYFLSKNRLSLVVFLATNLCLQIFQFKQWSNWDFKLLILCNGCFFIYSILTIYLLFRAIKHKNPNVFVRTVMLLSISKLLLVASIILVYRSINTQQLNIATVLILMGLYVLYTAIDLYETLQLNKRK